MYASLLSALCLVSLLGTVCSIDCWTSRMFPDETTPMGVSDLIECAASSRFCITTRHSGVDDGKAIRMCARPPVPPMHGIECGREGQTYSNERYFCCCASEECNTEGLCVMRKPALHWIGTDVRNGSGNAAFVPILVRRWGGSVVGVAGTELPAEKNYDVYGDADNATTGSPDVQPSQVAAQTNVDTRLKCWTDTEAHPARKSYCPKDSKYCITLQGFRATENGVEHVGKPQRFCDLLTCPEQGMGVHGSDRFFCCCSGDYCNGEDYPCRLDVSNGVWRYGGYHMNVSFQAAGGQARGQSRRSLTDVVIMEPSKSLSASAEAPGASSLVKSETPTLPSDDVKIATQHDAKQSPRNNEFFLASAVCAFVALALVGVVTALKLRAKNPRYKPAATQPSEL